MKRKKRSLTPKERSELWKRWKAGQSLREIGAALCRHSATVHWHLKQDGGIQPRERSRSAGHLTLADREEISRGLVSGLSLREIGRQLARPASTICREVGRNGGREAYRATAADKAAWDRARRPKTCALSLNAKLRNAVARKLKRDWSPEQIAGWLRDKHGNNPAMQVSHETIYRSLFMQARGALKKELVECLRSGRQLRRTLEIPPNMRGQIVGAVTIRERPAEAEDRAVPGHWEGDLIFSANGGCIATLVERHSRYVILVCLSGKDSTTVVDALIAQMKKLPSHLAGSLTWDRGTELAQHQRFTLATDMQVYFCDPRSPWQRGSNENTNGLLRQYLPTTADFTAYTQRQLDAIAKKLNTRPRKTLGFKTPAYKLNASVALIG
jgi:IS30 family transposase